MTCFWIGINHVSHGLKKVTPDKRLTLELVSLMLLLITWCFTIPGIITLAQAGLHTELVRAVNYLTGNRSPVKIAGADCAASVEGGCEFNILKAVGNNIFVIFNTIYTIVSALLLILNLIFRKEFLTLGQRPQARQCEISGENDEMSTQYCCNICSPCNALRMFHHVEHRGAFIVNLVCACLGVEFYFSIPLVILTFSQTIISYLYAEDLVLCGLPVCCVYLLFVRRYPQEDMVDRDVKMDNVLSV